MAPDGTPNAGGRDAEHAARRTSSCAFADNVAAAAMRAYDAVLAHLAHLDPSRPTERGQTVLAAVVARDARCDPPRLRVVSLGAGTKFLRAADIDADARSGTKVRDCHAEVLARRGLKRFLYAQIRAARRREKSSSAAFSANLADEEEWLVLDPVFHEPEVGLETDRTDRRADGWRVSDEVSFHLYASSAPCGNATVKKWARGLKETFDDSLGPFELPRHGENEHDKKNNSFGSVSQGQLAFLWKRDNSDPCESEKTEMEFESAAVPVPGRDFSLKKNANTSDAVPPGTSTRGRLLTCSDKLAVWSCVGAQGALLLEQGFLAEPVRFASVTIGRKFNRAVGRRALCCRMRRFAVPERFAALENGKHFALEVESGEKPDRTDRKRLVRLNEPGTDFVHPTLLCTATPFDAGRYAEGEGADFGSADAIVAWLGDDAGGDGLFFGALAAAAELLNGRTGERVPVPNVPPREEEEEEGSRRGEKKTQRDPASGVECFMSGVSRAALAAAHAACDGSAPSVAEGALTPDAGGSAYAARKAEAGATSGYAEAKREALSQPGLWSLSAPHRHASTTPTQTGRT
jgi:double-stranded RNA-specific adenosine deaminase